MPQSSIIFFYLFAGFVVYITVKGELPTYMAILSGSSGNSGGSSSASGWSPTQPSGVSSGTPFSIPDDGMDVPSGGAVGGV